MCGCFSGDNRQGAVVLDWFFSDWLRKTIQPHADVVAMGLSTAHYQYITVLPVSPHVCGQSGRQNMSHTVIKYIILWNVIMCSKYDHIFIFIFSFLFPVAFKKVQRFNCEEIETSENVPLFLWLGATLTQNSSSLLHITDSHWTLSPLCCPPTLYFAYKCEYTLSLCIPLCII